MIYLGIDPGAKGGYAWIDTEIKCNTATTMPYNEYEFVRSIENIVYLSQAKNIRCCIEKVGAMPKQGVTSMFNFGMNFGILKGVLLANHISFQEISPRRWKKEFNLDNDKKKSIRICQELFPYVDLLPTERSRVPSDGMAEALLIAEYARRTL